LLFSLHYTLHFLCANQNAENLCSVKSVKKKKRKKRSLATPTIGVRSKQIHFLTAPKITHCILNSSYSFDPLPFLIKGTSFGGWASGLRGGCWSGSGGGVGLASFLSVSGRGPLFSSRKTHFQKCQVWYNPEVKAKI
jgi:hypothetical protein